MSKTTKRKTTIEVNARLGEIEVDVEYAYYKGDPGRTYGPPENCYPSEPAYVEIIAVIYKNIDIADYLSDEITTKLEEEIHAKLDAEQAEYEEGLFDCGGSFDWETKE